MTPVTKIYWLFKPHCHEARPVKVISCMQRLVPGDPRSSRPIGQDTVWRCEHVVQPESST